MTDRKSSVPTREEWAVAIATAGYVGVFTVWFLSIGNYEFVVYIATMLGLIALVALSLRKAAYPVPMLWALSAWGLLHMAGGGIPVGEGVLYGVPLIPLIEDGEMTILKYDQFVHAYGFGISAWVLWHLLVRHFPATRRTATAYFYPIFGAMGLGALNEMIEFSAVLLVQDTGVGGYLNTSLDLVFNALGAGIAMIVVARFERRAA